MKIESKVFIFSNNFVGVPKYHLYDVLQGGCKISTVFL